jgi:hypothetical protein
MKFERHLGAEGAFVLLNALDPLVRAAHFLLSSLHANSLPRLIRRCTTSLFHVVGAVRDVHVLNRVSGKRVRSVYTQAGSHGTIHTHTRTHTHTLSLFLSLAFAMRSTTTRTASVNLHASHLLASVSRAVVAMQCLSEDYSKIVMALADRTIEVHARYGFHYRTRVPKHCRAMAYHFPSCDLIVAGSSSELWRLNLDQGRFLTPYEVEHGSAVNAVEINPLHGLICAGTDAGYVECFDPRSRERAGALDVARWIPADQRDSRGRVPEATAIECFANGLTMAVGTSSGHVLLFDLRSSRPHLTKDHNNGLPVHTVTHHPSSENVVSADAKGIKIWSEHSGDNYTSIEAAADLNQVCIAYTPIGFDGIATTTTATQLPQQRSAIIISARPLTNSLTHSSTHPRAAIAVTLAFRCALCRALG